MIHWNCSHKKRGKMNKEELDEKVNKALGSDSEFAFTVKLVVESFVTATINSAVNQYDLPAELAEIVVAKSMEKAAEQRALRAAKNAIENTEIPSGTVAKAFGAGRSTLYRMVKEVKE